jgi:hypothetical protein
VGTPSQKRSVEGLSSQLPVIQAKSKDLVFLSALAESKSIDRASGLIKQNTEALPGTAPTGLIQTSELVPSVLPVSLRLPVFQESLPVAQLASAQNPSDLPKTVPTLAKSVIAEAAAEPTSTTPMATGFSLASNSAVDQQKAAMPVPVPVSVALPIPMPAVEAVVEVVVEAPVFSLEKGQRVDLQLKEIAQKYGWSLNWDAPAFEAQISTTFVAGSFEKFIGVFISGASEAGTNLKAVFYRGNKTLRISEF